MRDPVSTTSLDLCKGLIVEREKVGWEMKRGTWPKDADSAVRSALDLPADPSRYARFLPCPLTVIMADPLSDALRREIGQVRSVPALGTQPDLPVTQHFVIGFPGPVISEHITTLVQKYYVG